MTAPRLSPDDEPNPADDRLIDRLVDGELSGAERRALLARLDAEPGGWRRCALAFLESQAWAEALGPSAGLSAAGRTSAVVVDRFGRVRPSGGPRLRAFTATAAAVLLAFALGWGVRGTRTHGPFAGAMATLSTPPVPVPDPCGRAAPAVAPASAGGTRLASAEVPPPPDELEALPEPVVERWEQQGYRVEHRQRVVPMELSDGRRLAVPVDEVRLRFVGDRTY